MTSYHLLFGIHVHYPRQIHPASFTVPTMSCTCNSMVDDESVRARGCVCACVRACVNVCACVCVFICAYACVHIHNTIIIITQFDDVRGVTVCLTTYFVLCLRRRPMS